MAFNINTNLEAPPFRLPIYDKSGVMNSTWVRYFQGIWDRVGGASGGLIYDNANSTQQTSSLEPQLFAIRADLENQLTGIVLQIIEQVQEQLFDPAGLISETFDPPTELEPPDSQLAGFIQAALDTASVNSVFGRTGDIVATEGDYSLGQLSDVTIAGPSNNDVLTYDTGTGQWTPQAFTSGKFSGTLDVNKGGTGQSSLTLNNVILGNGTSAVQFVAPGSSGNVLTSNGTTWQSTAPSAVSTAPSYDRIVATAGQTVFNTTVNTVANGSGKAYLMVTKNGLVLSEGGGNDYTVTGANQITLTAGATLSDVLTFRAFT